MHKLILFLLSFSFIGHAMDQMLAKVKVHDIMRKDTDPAQLKIFLRTNFSPNSSQLNLSTLLKIAIEKNAPRCMRFLLERGAALTFIEDEGFEEPLLHHALYEKHYKVAEILFEFGANPNAIISKTLQSPMLKMYATSGDWEQTKWLIEHGANPQINILTTENSNVYCSVLKFICEGTSKHADMPVEILHLFCAQGVDPNDSDTIRGDSCLHALIKRSGSPSSSKLALVMYLIGAGAEVNCTNNQGEAPLHIAAFSNEKNIAAYLLLKGANKNSVNKNKNTALEIVNVLSYNDVTRREYQDLKNMLESDELPEMPAAAIEAEKKLKQKIV